MSEAKFESVVELIKKQKEILELSNELAHLPLWSAAENRSCAAIG